MFYFEKTSSEEYAIYLYFIILNRCRSSRLREVNAKLPKWFHLCVFYNAACAYRAAHAPAPLKNQQDREFRLESAGSAYDDAVPAKALIGLVARGGVKCDGGSVAAGVKAMRLAASLDLEMTFEGMGALR